jgi:U2-associated protein SR140
MLFALDHASAAQDVAEMLTESLTLAETPVAAKVARLFLVSDILHNSGAPVKHAAAYRRAFQDHLPRVFESLRGTLRDMSSRIAREALKKRVGAVLAAWSDWFLFQDEFLRGLEATFALGAASAADALPTEEIEKLRAKYGAMREEDLERACRTRGLVADEGPQACVERLVELDAHERTETTPASANLHGGKE